MIKPVTLLLSLSCAVFVLSSCRIEPKELGENLRSDMRAEAVTPEKRGMSWGVLPSPPVKGHVNLSCHGKPPVSQTQASCDAYRGDTSCAIALPLLCLRKGDYPRPEALKMDRDIYNSWASAEVRLSKPVMGALLSSVEQADNICRREFGHGWRIAEFHDGWGWGFWAKGAVSDRSRFWVHINDQPANCWDRR